MALTFNDPFLGWARSLHIVAPGWASCQRSLLPRFFSDLLFVYCRGGGGGGGGGWGGCNWQANMNL